MTSMRWKHLGIFLAASFILGFVVVSCLGPAHSQGGGIGVTPPVLNIGVAGGVQAYDADLTTWAGITPGTGIAAALAINVGSAGAPVLFNGNGGTPSAMVGTNITNVNAATLGGATFAAPGDIGGTTPAAGRFTTGAFGQAYQSRATLEAYNAAGSPILTLYNPGSITFDFTRSATTGALEIQGSQTGNNDLVIGPTSGNLYAAQAIAVGGNPSTAPTVSLGEIALKKITASGAGPGATFGKIALVCGTNAGSAKLIAYAGTSNTAATILDNIGSGVSGC